MAKDTFSTTLDERTPQSPKGFGGCLSSATCGGAGGSRTLVQTRKQYAFYMLISAFGFRVPARPEPPTDTLASRTSYRLRGEACTIPDFTAPLYQTPRNKSFWATSCPYHCGRDKADLLYFDQAARA